MNQKQKYSLLFVALGAITFIPGLGSVHLFDWDEINFAEIAREMIVLEEYGRIYVNFLPFWQKPPLFFWLQALAMHIFGVSEFAARFPNAVFGILTLPLIYQVGRKLVNHRFGVIWTLAYYGAILPSFYFQSGIIDPVFNFFIFFGLYFFVLFVWKRNNIPAQLNYGPYTYLILGGLSTGAAILTKGPVAFLILCLCFGVYWVLKRFKMFISVGQFLLFGIVAAFFSLLWYGIETLSNGPWFITEFIKYNYLLFSTEDAGHGGFFGYHFVIIFFGCFPASPFALKAFKRQYFDAEHQQDFKRWMMILLWVILILFSIVQSKIVHYSSMAYFPVTYLAALSLYEIVEGKWKVDRWIDAFVYVAVGVVAIAIIALPIIGLNAQDLRLLIDDEFVQGNLEANVPWSGFEILLGVALLLVAIIGLRKMRAVNPMQGIIILFVGTTLVMKVTNLVVTKKIEGYSQRANIEFFESLQGEDAYIHSVGYKTYAHYFYARMTPSTRPFIQDSNDWKQVQEWEKWLLEGDIDKPAYFSVKSPTASYMSSMPQLDSLYAKNGFVFYRRDPSGKVDN